MPPIAIVRRTSWLGAYPCSVIVVIGTPRFATDEDGEPVAAGLAVDIAAAAVRLGAAVEFSGRIGDDERADAIVLDLGRRGIGHAALLRLGGLRVTDDSDAGPPTGPAAADVDLALRYLTGYAVVVVADELAPDALDAAMEAAAWCDAHLVVISRYEGPPMGLPESSTVLEPPDDGGEAFAAFVGAYAAAIDRGDDAATAFAALESSFVPERIG